MDGDRELLERAARAMGWSAGHKWNRARLEMVPPVTALVVHDAKGELMHTAWNPLSDDGDEARLEAVLCLDVIWFEKQVDVNRVTENYADHGGDKQAARRRAGVRAAAAMAPAKESGHG